MSNFNDKIYDSYINSCNLYLKNFQSNHWSYQIKKKKELYKIENLKNFRNNNLSQGLDDQFYNDSQTTNLFNTLINEEGENFVYKMLDSQNIGNVNNIHKFKQKIYSSNEIFHIKYLSKINDYLKLKNSSLICEIGPGYGCLVSKILKIYNCKIILIDLPESNFLSAYFLKSLFPEKKFFLTSDIKNNEVKQKDILDNDIIIICPWDNLPNIKFDLFINSRSMMEMNKESIKHYFNMIQSQLNINGYFLCINRYYKDTVGYPIELHNYPFDKYWDVILSEKSWGQDHVHFLFLRRTQKEQIYIIKELEKIKYQSKLQIKNDPRLIRRIMPDFFYKIYKRIKFLIFNK